MEFGAIFFETGWMMKPNGRGSGDKSNVGRKSKSPGEKRVNRSIRANDTEWEIVSGLAREWGCSIPDAVIRASMVASDATPAELAAMLEKYPLE